MTTIEWTQRPGTRGESWNPVRARNRASGGLGHFCEHVSEGCRNCYAERMQPRFGNRIRYAAQDRAKVEIFLDEAKLAAPLHWRKPRTVFVCSMTDLFGEWVEDAWLDRIFDNMYLTTRHTYQVLTKRPERMRDYLKTVERRLHGDLARFFCNIWLGVSVEDQATAEARIPALLETPAAIRFVSYEPALGPVDFRRLDVPGHGYLDALTPGYFIDHKPPRRGLDWIIAGGESGPKARPAVPRWFRGVRHQCAAAGVPFFYKQWGAWAPGGEHLPFRGATHVWPDGAVMHRVGKKAAGRRLDGKEHSAWPL